MAAVYPVLGTRNGEFESERHRFLEVIDEGVIFPVFHIGNFLDRTVAPALVSGNRVTEKGIHFSEIEWTGFP